MSKSDKVKRTSDDAENAESVSMKKSVKKQSPFEQGTTEASWIPEGNPDRKYIIRYVNEDTCCDFPWHDVKAWPKLSLSIAFDEDDDGTDIEPMKVAIIGAVWKEDSGELVAVWGEIIDDSHIEFFCDEDFMYAEELNEVTGKLTGEIAPATIDIFDDGSGGDREGTLVPGDELRSCKMLTELYKRK